MLSSNQNLIGKNCTLQTLEKIDKLYPAKIDNNLNWKQQISNLAIMLTGHMISLLITANYFSPV